MPGSYVTLFDWYPRHIPVYRAKLTVPVGRHFLSVGEPYPPDTVVLCVVDDPERPGMADVQLPNGDLIRRMRSDVTLIEKVR